MDTKTYEVKIKANKTFEETTFTLYAKKGNAAYAISSPPVISDLEHIILTNDKHAMYEIYGSQNTTLVTLSDKFRALDDLTNYIDLFYECSQLDFSTINLTDFVGGKVIRANNMFYNCKNMTHIDLSAFDGSEVQTMSSMFRECSNLKSLNLSSFNTTNVRIFDSMFENCVSLEHIDCVFDFAALPRELVPWPGDNSITMQQIGVSNMFTNCMNISGLQFKNVPEWFFELVTLSTDSYGQYNPDTKYGYEWMGLNRDQFEIVE